MEKEKPKRLLSPGHFQAEAERLLVVMQSKITSNQEITQSDLNKIETILASLNEMNIVQKNFIKGFNSEKMISHELSANLILTVAVLLLIGVVCSLSTYTFLTGSSEIALQLFETSLAAVAVLVMCYLPIHRNLRTTHRVTDQNIQKLKEVLNEEKIKKEKLELTLEENPEIHYATLSENHAQFYGQNDE